MTKLARLRSWIAMVFAGVLALTGVQFAGAATAAPSGSRIVSIKEIGPQNQIFTVYSAAMKREIPLDVLRPRNRGAAPTLYLLNGLSGGEGEGNWEDKTQYKKFFADKQVNVVTPLKGLGSYYTNWVKYDARAGGNNKWETFLADELPPLLDRALGATGKTGLTGVSMSATSVLSLAVRRPGQFPVVASFSGCAQTSDPIGQEFIAQVVVGRVGAKMENMWGPLDGPLWRAHDPVVNAAKLRGTSLYLSAMSGLPGQDENPMNPKNLDPGYLDRVVLGGGIEAATFLCTVNLSNRLDQLNIPATTVLRPNGTHSWGYFERELHASWPQVRRALM